MESLTLTLTSVIFYVKYKQRESALRVFPLFFSHGVINYFISLRNVNQMKKYILKIKSIKTGEKLRKIVVSRPGCQSGHSGVGLPIL